MSRFRLIIFGAGIFGAAMMTLCSATSAQAKQCSAERPANARSYWSYRLIDGRKCWYEGKQMISKSLLHWPSSKAAHTGAKSNAARAGQSTLLDAQASISDLPAAKPEPELKREMADAGPAPASERRLTPDHLRAWGNSMAVIAAEPVLTIMDRWPDAELPRHQRGAATAEAASPIGPRMILMMTIILMAVFAVLISVNFHRRGAAGRKSALERRSGFRHDDMRLNLG
jgi:hypothetical protein